jgi:hypothetical protein
MEDKAFAVKRVPSKRHRIITVRILTTITEKPPKRSADLFLHLITLKAAVRLPTKAYMV